MNNSNNKINKKKSHCKTKTWNSAFWAAGHNLEPINSSYLYFSMKELVTFLCGPMPIRLKDAYFVLILHAA